MFIEGGKVEEGKAEQVLSLVKVRVCPLSILVQLTRSSELLSLPTVAPVRWVLKNKLHSQYSNLLKWYTAQFVFFKCVSFTSLKFFSLCIEYNVYYKYQLGCIIHL